MSQARTAKLYSQFTKGLITEASALTYPPNATLDEDNCLLSRKGNRSRRLGIGFEYGGTATVVKYLKTYYDTCAISEYKWESAGNVSGLDYLAVQVGIDISFFLLGTGAISAGPPPLSLNLTPFIKAGVTSPETYRVAMSSGKGYLFVVGEHIDPIIVEYNQTTNLVTATKIYIQIRDFKGVDDGLANDQEPTTLSALHEYNLRNQGWVNPSNDGSGTTVTYYNQFGGTGTYPAPTSAPIATYYSAVSRYPPNNKQWFTGKDSSGVFTPSLLQKFFSGNNRAPRGHYVLNAFNLDRTAVSGVSGISVETTYERPISVSFFAGRVFYVSNSTVYFSQVLEDKRQAGFCYQEADPTSEDISDLIATDGGVIPIPEMSKAIRLVPAGSGILVFATNGIWMVSGTSAGFTATDISVSKVSPIGSESPDSIVEAEGQFYWWSKVGIMGMSQKIGVFGPIEGSFERSNISEQSIQTLYNEIPYDSKRYVKGIFDPANNTIQWIYSSDYAYRHRYDKILNLDLGLQAFYPWTISSDPTTPWLSGILTTPTINDLSIDINVDIKLSFTKYLTVHPDSTYYVLAFSSFRDTTFQDWGTETYLSFMESGYELLEDAMRKKWTPYVVTHFKRTEDLFIPDGDDYDVRHKSSCKMFVKWDWSSSPASNKWSNSEEAYRLKNVGFVDENDLTVDTGFAIVSTKRKVRGSGRAIQFRFECGDADRDFNLLGWAVEYSGNTRL